MSSPIGLRERKKQETREALASAALHLAVERGPDGVTVDEISAAANVSPRTFFNYFSSKDEAILAVTHDPGQVMLDDLENRPACESPLQAVREALIAGSEPLSRTPAETRLRMRVLLAGTPSLQASYRAKWSAVERSVAEIIGRRVGLEADHDMYVSLLGAGAMAAFRVALERWWHADDDTPSLAELITLAFDHLANGLQPPAGSREPIPLPT